MVYVDVLTSASTPVTRCSAPLVLLGGRGPSALRPGALLAGARVRRRGQLICLLGTPTMAPKRRTGFERIVTQSTRLALGGSSHNAYPDPRLLIPIPRMPDEDANALRAASPGAAASVSIPKFAHPYGTR